MMTISFTVVVLESRPTSTLRATSRMTVYTVNALRLGVAIPVLYDTGDVLLAASHQALPVRLATRHGDAETVGVVDRMG